MEGSVIAKLRWSTPVVRRDQDGGHRSESRVQRFPFFALLFHVSLMFSRAHFFRFYGTTIGKRRKKIQKDSRSSFLAVHYLAREEAGEDGEETSPDKFSWFGGVPLRAESRRDSDGNGKQEDLVRLALKRLNVSYLTILSRLVRFERETLVCHARARGSRGEHSRIGKIQFFAMKWNLHALYYLFVRFIIFLLRLKFHFVKNYCHILRFNLIKVSPIYIEFKLILCFR